MASHLGCDEATKRALLLATANRLQNIDKDVAPPDAAVSIYHALHAILGSNDPYRQIKIDSIHAAKRLVPELQETIEKANDPIRTAITVAVLGNVIDYGTQEHYCLTEESKKIFHTPFAIDHSQAFKEALSQAKTLLYIGDNAGENILDELLVKTIKQCYPQIAITYLTRGAPIINDITMEDLRGCEMHDFAEVTSSGVESPGFIWHRVSPDIQERFNQSDLILAKGMGNYESLESLKDDRLFLLFKVKCDVVSRFVGQTLGSLLFIQNKSTLG